MNSKMKYCEQDCDEVCEDILRRDAEMEYAHDDDEVTRDNDYGYTRCGGRRGNCRCEQERDCGCRDNNRGRNCGCRDNDRERDCGCRGNNRGRNCGCRDNDRERDCECRGNNRGRNRCREQERDCRCRSQNDDCNVEVDVKTYPYDILDNESCVLKTIVIKIRRA